MVHPCTECVKADVCGKMQEYESAKRAAENLTIEIGDQGIARVQDMDWIEVPVFCKKLLHQRCATPTIRTASLADPMPAGYDTGRGGTDSP